MNITWDKSYWIAPSMNILLCDQCSVTEQETCPHGWYSDLPVS